ncbi:SAM hydrolase/SAM-dependent halogenase family protein [Rhodohalobacter halophilus]|uniref:SAM hydrolase/SAM-dependent halogenase family protein n=1 Tax=Rhodohalobacter halophilus TaxID=1812810 RepID=UPI00083FD612|nr:SAM-dependent chlorinase/fluorinase [Rhodohalobacter halophilus]
MSNIVTLTTDFGLQDHYVSVMKAVMLEVSPDLRFIDISHQIPPQDIMAGAWVLKNASMEFPPGTVHLVVVDPGVGTERHAVAVKIQDQLFVGPDNGIFSLIGDEYEYEAYRLSNSKFWKKKPSNTFHGRDIFAPVAAHLANGVSLSDLGEPVEELVTYRWAVPISDRDGIQGWVIHIDRYGNLVTNITSEMIRESVNSSRFRIYAGNTILDKIVPTFNSVEDGEPAAYIGSSDTLEIAINKGNAQEMLGVQKGAQISIIIQK